MVSSNDSLVFRFLKTPAYPAHPIPLPAHAPYPPEMQCFFRHFEYQNHHHIQKRHLSGAHTLINIDLAEHAFGFLRLRLLLFLHLFRLLLAFLRASPLPHGSYAWRQTVLPERLAAAFRALTKAGAAQQQDQCQYQKGYDNDPRSLINQKETYNKETQEGTDQPPLAAISPRKISMESCR